MRVWGWEFLLMVLQIGNSLGNSRHEKKTRSLWRVTFAEVGGIAVDFYSRHPATTIRRHTAVSRKNLVITGQDAAQLRQSAIIKVSADTSSRNSIAMRHRQTHAIASRRHFKPHVLRD